ncbi:3-oxoadipate enol-lactonase [Amycolatopsis jiangsuensis]|uniref:3-oxoadipate enol-lactonase n=1 Tax=Amycolatopsis jiangsuensis TaxID=1181879 RepID=A0A840IVC8_9PSEU|nr:3-oxoadipate enol-lactonase [Amycolatopsis jiangsuensis]MBB4685385.1 3-oxoadipate enol-lactonase [Amycolatopsis jiangsuensis]
MSGVRVHRVVEGPENGPVVVLSNSIGSDHRMWEPQVAPLVERGFRVVRYDTRGHGASPVPSGPYEVADLGGDVLALLDDLGVARAHFAGLSLGGMTGLWLGVHAAGRLASLTLCCTSARLGPPQMWADRARLVRAEGTVAVAEASVGRWVTPAYSRAHPDRAAFLRDMIAAQPSEGYAACCGAIERMDLLGELPKIAVPALVIAGADDPSTPVEPHGRQLAESIPGTRLEVMASAAHLGSYEQPGEFTRLLLEQIMENE